jgi:hypothetical protein
MGPTFLALGLTMPGLLLQDGWRSAFFAAGQGLQAFRNDLVWACALLPALALLVAAGETSVFWLTFAWGGAATVAAIVGVAETSIGDAACEPTSWPPSRYPCSCGQ